ncbi:response regulator [Streptomyces kaempferi]
MEVDVADGRHRSPYPADPDRRSGPRPLLVTALRALLGAEAELEAVGVADSRPQLLRLLDEQEPRVVLIDDSDPGWETGDILRAVAERADGVAVVVLVDQCVDETALEYLRAGADGFVPLDAALSEIATAIRAVSDGYAVLPPPLTRRLVDLLVRRGLRRWWCRRCRR